MALIYLEPLPRRASKADILALLDNAGGLNRRRVGKIELRGTQAVVEVPDDWEARLVRLLNGQALGDRRVRAWAGGQPSIIRGEENHFQRLARLLDLESRAETQRAAEQARRLSPQEAQQSGNTLVDLVVADEQAGLGGRYVVQLGKRGQTPLPWTRLDVGSPVILSPNAARVEQSHRGVVCERCEQSICVALDRLPEDLGEYQAWRLDLSFDEVSVQRQRVALQQAGQARGDRFAILRDVLLGVRQPEFGVDPEVRPLDANLNAVQREAVQFANCGTTRSTCSSNGTRTYELPGSSSSRHWPSSARPGDTPGRPPSPALGGRSGRTPSRCWPMPGGSRCRRWKAFWTRPASCARRPRGSTARSWAPGGSIWP